MLVDTPGPRLQARIATAQRHVLDEDAVEELVVVLREPRLEGDTLSYRVEILEGSLPLSFGPCTLFIDVFGRPLAPASGGGEQRRGLAKRG